MSGRRSASGLGGALGSFAEEVQQPAYGCSEGSANGSVAEEPPARLSLHVETFTGSGTKASGNAAPRGYSNPAKFNSHSQAFIEYSGGRLDISVLVISADHEVRGALVQVLRLLGCSRVSESSGAQAVGHLLEPTSPVRSFGRPNPQSSAGVGLIFCDLELASAALQTVQESMGGGDLGDEEHNVNADEEIRPKLTRRASSLGKSQIPIVVLCEKRFARETLSAALEKGASGYIPKPLRIQAIRGAVVRYGLRDHQGTFRSEVSAGSGDSDGKGGYEKVELIGKGGFGQVFLVRRCADGACYAQKEIRINNLDFRAQRRVLTELTLHRSFDCPFIVQSFRAWVSGDFAYILMEYCREGPLSKRVSECQKDGTQIPDESIITWCGQLCIGLMYLHQKDVIHRDLKLENILGPDGLDRVKLADFGISRQLQTTTKQPMSFMIGTAMNMAPERFGADEGACSYGISSDFWGLGVCLYELTMLSHPFTKSTASASSGNVEPTSVFSQICEYEVPPLPFTRAAVLHRVITGGLLQKQAVKRPTGKQLCHEPEIGAAIHVSLRRCGLLGNAAVLEVITVVEIGKGEKGVACPVEEDAVELHQAKSKAGLSLEESVAPLALELEASFSGDHAAFPGTQKPPKLAVPLSASEGSDFAVRMEELQQLLASEKREVSRILKLAQSTQEHVEQQTRQVAEFCAGKSLRWSLCFRDSRLETGYIRGRAGRLNLHFIVGVLALTAVACIFSALQQQGLRRVSWREPSEDSWQDSAVVILLGFAAFNMLILLFTFGAQCRAGTGGSSFSRGVRAKLLEFTSAGLVICLAMLAIAVDPFMEKGGGRLGLPPRQAVGASMMPLASIAFSLLPRLLPIRWFFLFLAHLAFSASFTACMVIEGFTAQEVVWRTLSAATLGFGLLMERRSAERGDRFQLLMRSGVLPSPPEKNKSEPMFGYQKSMSQQLFSLFERQKNHDREDEQVDRDDIEMSRGDSQYEEDDEVPEVPEFPKKPGFGRSGSNVSAASGFMPPLGRSQSNLNVVGGNVIMPRLNRQASNVSATSFQSRASRSNSSILSMSSATLMGIRLPKIRLRRSNSLESEVLFGNGCDDAEIMKAESLRNIQRQGSKESWLLNPTRVQVDADAATVGEGGFGTVVKGTLYGAVVALKLPKTSNGEIHSELINAANSLSNELRVLRHVWHPNIVRFYGSCIDPGSAGMVIVLEMIEGVQLDTFACDDDTRELNPRGKHQLLLDIASALRYLHAQKPVIVHGDLKGSNILVELWLSGPRAKLLDFGLSRLLTKKANPLGGTVAWMAPEVIRGRSGGPPAPSADVFSFGRLAFMVVVGRRPLTDKTAEEVLQDVRHLTITPLQWPLDAEMVPLQEECQTLAERCLTIRALMRPSIIDVCARLSEWQMTGEDELMFTERTAPEGITSLERGLSVVTQQGKRRHPFERFWESVWLLLSTGALQPREDRPLALLRGIEVAAKHRHRLITPDRLMLLPDKVLSVGEFGFVVDARLDGARAAVRVPRGRLKVTTPAASAALLQEMKDLMLIRHPCIVALHGLCVEQDLGMVTPVLEWVEGVALDAFVKNAALGLGRVPVETRQHLLQGISSALWCLHEQKPPITHGDLKGTNILVESRAEGPPRAKLLDFGWSRLLEREAGGKRMGAASAAWLQREHDRKAKEDVDLGSSPYGLGNRPKDMLWMAIKWRLTNRRRRLVWTAPEVLNAKNGTPQDGLEPSSDVFAFGRVCYLVCTGREPLNNLESKQIEEAMRRGVAPLMDWPDAWPELRSLKQQLREIENEGITLPKDASLVSMARPLVDRCCNPNPLLRPAIDNVFQDVTSWIKRSIEKANASASATLRGTSARVLKAGQFDSSSSRVSFQDEAPVSPKNWGSGAISPKSGDFSCGTSPAMSAGGASHSGDPDARQLAARPKGGPLDEGVGEEVPTEKHVPAVDWLCPAGRHPMRFACTSTQVTCCNCNMGMAVGVQYWNCSDCALDMCEACEACFRLWKIHSLPVSNRIGPMLGPPKISQTRRPGMHSLGEEECTDSPKGASRV
mmetsp:Transcript_154988/g.496761  ORF Transcript_154988/g.496761 Transcript_154988/m.496761 type:complete len:2043 (-) Transcript_154988:113-6241(-)